MLTLPTKPGHSFQSLRLGGKKMSNSADTISRLGGLSFQTQKNVAFFQKFTPTGSHLSREPKKIRFLKISTKPLSQWDGQALRNVAGVGGD
jgi:hypothetical protein